MARLPSLLLSSALAPLLFLACSAPPSSDPIVASTSEKVLCQSLGCGGVSKGGSSGGISLPLPKPLPNCNEVTAIVNPGTWAEAVQGYPGTATEATDWANAMIGHGCTTPESMWYGWVSGGTGTGFLWVTQCPAGLSGFVAPPEGTNWTELTLTCNSAVPLAPAGHLNIAWRFDGADFQDGGIYTPTQGCGMGECAGPPDLD